MRTANLYDWGAKLAGSYVRPHVNNNNKVTESLAVQYGMPKCRQSDEHLRIGYLISQFPAINHGYLFTEIRELRRGGIDVEVASVRLPDRPLGRLSVDEREEAKKIYYIKSAGIFGVLAAVVGFGLWRPVRFLQALWYALRLGVNMRRYLHGALYFAEALLLARWMHDRNLTHVHTHFSSTIALIAARLAPIQWSWTAHGYGELHDPSSFQLAEKIRQADFVRAISKFGRSQLMLECEPETWGKLEYSPLGIDTSRFAPRPFRERPYPIRISCIGRLAPEKGQRLLLSAVKRLVEQGRELRVHFVGDGPDRPDLERQCAENELSEYVVFEGWQGQDELRSVYRSTDILVLPSLYEGIPIVLMEAMAMEIPCVAPRVTGIPELICDRLEGLLFSPSDEEDLARCVGALMDSPPLRRKLGKMARQRVLRDWNIFINTGRLADMFLRRLSGETSTAAASRAAERDSIMAESTGLEQGILCEKDFGRLRRVPPTGLSS